ncbi:autophagy-related protein 22-like protein [Gamsiella multidivaricata]|uniref:autophagy-related protein 22-like protein n=1 Tax=Gamsiella multidivaricata TaxID=101098 RepID=UPI00221FA4C3|nr:autophagy-related protein 22-like protein [Gamsiella multidivaricata]KAI7818947.1 autophagy-related protein 22-like protein [Gamsiella multidivaricata]
MVPLLIQDVAASGSVEASKHSIPCDTSVPDYKCVKHIFGDIYLDPGTISLYISSFSAVVSFIVSLSIAAVADHEAYRKRLLVVFAILGCITSVAFFLVQSGPTFWLTILLSPLGWACYNVSSVFSNAFLPIYVRVHPKVLEAAECVEAHKILRAMDEKNKALAQNAAAGNVILATNTNSDYHSNQHSKNISRTSSGITQIGNVLVSPEATNASEFLMTEQRKVEEQVSNDLSARCSGAANVGAVIVQGICIGISEGMHGSLLSLQVAIAFTGVWWLGWTIAVMPWLDVRAGPPLPKGKNWITYSWSKNYKTFKSMRQLSQVTKFILAWFILSDGVNTVAALLYVITYQDLNFSHTKSLIMTIVISAMAFVGAYLFLFIRQFWSLSTKFMILLTLGLYGILTAYCVIPSHFTIELGLRYEWEAWAAIMYLGLIISTFYGVARVMMAELCPEGDESEWFSLFQLADKGSSWIGPFVTGAIQSATGEFRTGFWFPLALFAAGGALLLTVDMDRGKDEAIAYKARQRAKQQQMVSIPPLIIITAAEDINRQNSSRGPVWL